MKNAKGPAVTCTAIAMAVLTVVSCSAPGTPITVTDNGEDGENGDTLSLDEVVTSVHVGDVAGVLKSGPLPAPSGGSELAVAGNDSTINGGTFDLQIASDVPLDTLYVALEGGSGGYYQIDLPDSGGNLQSASARPFCGPRGSHRNNPRRCPRLTANVLREVDQTRLSPPQTAIPGATGSFNLCMRAREATTRLITPGACHTFDLVKVGSGDVQVTLSWNVDSDVDLHVVDPQGNEVYWGNKSVPSGGELDLDSNAGCRIDGVRNENVTWQGNAPNGTYKVRVDYWRSCGVEETDYTVRINNGSRTSTFTGTFTGDGDRGSAGSGVEVATFVHS